MSKPLLSVEGLHTAFHLEGGVLRAVNDVSFSLEPGRVLGIVGESGSGKSVTALSILRLVDPPGCNFRARCGRATDLCARKEPLLRAGIGGHRVACHLVNPEVGDPGS